MALINPDQKLNMTKLTNGITLASIQTKSDISTIGFWLKSGSMYETPANNGVAHFLEHMTFHGNKKYSRNFLELLADKKGMNLKASTSRTYTNFRAQVSPKNVPLAMDVLTHMVFNPSLLQPDIEEERLTILQEENEVNHDFNEVIIDNLHMNSFFGSPYSFPILGTKKTISSITQAQIREFHSKYFVPENSLLVCASPISHDKLVEFAKEATSFLETIPKAKDIMSLTKIASTNSQIKSDFTSRMSTFASPILKNAWISLGLPAPSGTDPFFFPAQILRNLIGEYSPLEVYEHPDRPDYTVRMQPNYFPYGTTGLLAITGEAPPKDLDKWLKTLMSIIFDSTIDSNEKNLQIGKLRLQNQIMKKTSINEQLAEDIGSSTLLLGKWFNPFDLKKELDKISPQTMKDYALKFLDGKQPSVSFILPQPPEEIRKLMEAQKQQAKQQQQSQNSAPKQTKPQTHIINPNGPTNGAKIIRPY